MPEPARKAVTLADFLTDSELRRCVALYRELGGGGGFVAAVEKEIMLPNLARINAALGQENDSRYLAYMVEYALMQVQRGRA